VQVQQAHRHPPQQLQKHPLQPGLGIAIIITTFAIITIIVIIIIVKSNDDGIGCGLMLLW